MAVLIAFPSSFSVVLICLVVMVMTLMLLAACSLVVGWNITRKLRSFGRLNHINSSLPGMAREMETLFTRMVYAQQKIDMSFRHGLAMPLTVCREVNLCVQGLQELVDDFHRLAGVVRAFPLHAVCEQPAANQQLRLHQAYEIV